MTRAVALGLTVASVVWLRHVGRGTLPTSSVVTLALGFTLISAWLAGDIVRRLRLPRVTGYLLFGLVLGPYLGNLVTADMAAQLQIVTRGAAALIAVMAGLMLNVSRLRHRAAEIVQVTGAALIACVSGLAFVAWLFWPWLPIAPEATGLSRVAMALMVGVIAASFSPTMTAAVVAETEARGPMTELVLAVTVLADSSLLLLFALALPLTRELTGAGTLVTAPLLVRMSWEVGGAIAFGVLTGASLALYVRYVARGATLALLATCVLLSQIGTIQDLQPLLAAVAAGLTIENLAPAQGEELRLAIRRGATPVLLIFFVSIGTMLHPALLLQMGLAGVALMAIRVVILRAAVRVACRSATTAAGAWTGLVSQAGITLGFAAALATEFGSWGQRLQLLLVSMLAINEIIGPLLFRSGLAAAGEIASGDPPALIVVSNREPYLHRHTPSGDIHVTATTGGVAVALDALLRKRGGIWVAHGAGDADREVVDTGDRVGVPPGQPAYALRRLWIDELTFSAYYGGFANEGLWPLCHQVDVRPSFRRAEWTAYQEVNAQFAGAIDDEMGSAESVPILIQDYHLALVAPALRRRRPLARTALFWHIPWPHPDRLRICPWHRDILEGLLANDLLAFQLEQDRHNFLHAVERVLPPDVDVDGPSVRYAGHTTAVISAPIGIDFDRIQTLTTEAAVAAERRRLANVFELTGQVVGVGVDRLDYTKGIPERLAALDDLLQQRPDLVPCLTFVQVGVPSRSELRDYATVEHDVMQAVAALNRKYGAARADRPVVRYHRTPFTLTSLVALYQLAQFCVVSSLHDGMNLVAKEFIASRHDEDGVLVLSNLAGAAEELTEALLINPYDREGFADALRTAVTMPREERRQRMRALRHTVAGRDIFLWASDILTGLDDLSGNRSGSPHDWRDIAV